MSATRSARQTHNRAPTEYIVAGDTRFAYRRFGQPGAVPLVFFQFFMGNLDNYDPAITDALAETREVILFDNAGVGQSSGTARDAVQGMAHDAAAFIDALGLRTIDLLGHSMGGEVSQQLLCDRPELVRRAVLVGTGPRGGEGMAAQKPQTGPLFTKKYEMQDEMWLPIMFAPSTTSQSAGRAYLGRIRARREDRDVPVSDQTATAHRAAATKWGAPAEDSFEYLREIRHPILVANGHTDIVIATVNSFILKQNLPDAHLILYPDSGHGAQFQYHELFVKQVQLFLEE